jgi:hypothetical protein
MFPYRDEQYTYEEALDLKHPAPEPIAQKHHAKQSKFSFDFCTTDQDLISIFFKAEINMTFETVEDVAGFTSTVFSSSKEKVYVVEPTFINPRKTDELFHDYSTNCTIM